MNVIKKFTPGLLLAAVLAAVSINISKLIPNQLISGGVFALIIGMMLNPLLHKYDIFKNGINLTSKKY